VEVQLHTFLTLALDGNELLASCPGCFYPWGEAPVFIECFIHVYIWCMDIFNFLKNIDII
jgi:hypothetical protein